MNKFDLEQNVTNQADSQWLAESGLMEGIKPDDKWITWTYHYADPDKKEEWITELKNKMNPKIQGTFVSEYSAYRLDKLLAVLPEWCFSRHTTREGLANLFTSSIPRDDLTVYFCEQLSILIDKVRYQRGQEAIKAAVALIRLLYEEGLIK